MRTIHASTLCAVFALAASVATTSAVAKFPGQLQPGQNEIADGVSRTIKNNETREFGAKFDPVIIQKMKIRIETDNKNRRILTTITEGVDPQCSLVGLEDNKPARLFAVVTDGEILQRVELRAFSMGKSDSQPLTEIHRSGPLHIPNPTELTLVFHGKCREN
ncbi:MAG TPA: hypothetical protein VLX85_06940 [Stellaceae bacterium]|nr:hypothetical protein [Stellaceae bacterium]